MIDDDLDWEDLVVMFDEETEEWLKTVASTCLAHMKYMDTAEPEALNVEDFGLLELERAFITLYTARQLETGGSEIEDETQH